MNMPLRAMSGARLRNKRVTIGAARMTYER